MQAVLKHRRVEDAETDRAVWSGRIVEIGKQRLDVRPNVVVVGGANGDTIDQHANRRPVDRNRLWQRREGPAEVDEAGARRRCLLETACRVSRTAASRSRLRTSSCAPQDDPLPLTILRPHREAIGAVPLARQHVGQDHEAPPGPSRAGRSETPTPRQGARRR